MKRWRIFVLIFIVGLLIGAIFRLSQNQSKILSISSHLPELSFPPKEEPPFSILFTGDVMLGRSVNTRILKFSDPTWPFKNISSYLSEADLTVINLEAPFVEGCQPIDTGMLFCANPDSIAGLTVSGVDVASLANNHTQNFGQKGFENTISVLSSAGITPLISEKIEFKSVKNHQIALISFNDLPEITLNSISTPIALASNSADIIIVTFHWGNEYQKTPSKRQIELAHLAVDSGADLVVGTHPHVTQTTETYQNKPIYYSLGNLVFDQMWSEETRLGEILKVTFLGNNIVKTEITKVRIDNYGQPVIISN